MTEKQLNTFCANVRALMAAEGLLQTKLADECGINRSSMSRILDGKREPKLEHALAIAQRFGRKIDDLINESVIKD